MPEIHSIPGAIASGQKMPLTQLIDRFYDPRLFPAALRREFELGSIGITVPGVISNLVDELQHHLAINKGTTDEDIRGALKKAVTRTERKEPINVCLLQFG